MMFLLLLVIAVIVFATMLAVRKHHEEMKSNSQGKNRPKQGVAGRTKGNSLADLPVQKQKKLDRQGNNEIENGKSVSMLNKTSFVPEYAIEEAERFKKEFLLENSESASDLQYVFLYNKKGEACLEFTVSPKGGYTWRKPTWIGYTWGNIKGSIGNGKVKYTLTKKLADESQFSMEQRRRYPVFVEIEKVVLQIAKEYQYDFESAYGISVKYRNPNVKKAVCGGYSDAVAEVFANHPLVNKVEKWSSSKGNHAWNVLILKNGRKLYCDVTWYQGNDIDEEGYVVDVPAQNPVNLTFDLDEFNSSGGAINTATGKLLAVHFAWNDAKISGR